MSNEIKIIPYSGIVFTSNELKVTTPIPDIGNVDHTGNYIITSSSYSDDKHLGFNAFNSNTDNYWMCDFSGNPNYDARTFDYKTPYTQDPYLMAKNQPSMYQSNGGGSPSNTFSTKINASSISGNITSTTGEWLQIQVPESMAIYLTTYSLLTPSYTGTKTSMKPISTFPQNFMLLGSMDPVQNGWDIIDTHNYTKEIDTSSGNATAFKVKSQNPACYFRIVVNSLFQNNSILQISNLSLSGTKNQTDSFENMSLTPIEDAYTNQITNIGSTSRKQSNSSNYKAYSFYETVTIPYSTNAPVEGFVENNNLYVGSQIAMYNSNLATLQHAQNDKYDLSAGKLAYLKTPSTINDALREDSLTMIEAENNMYILGSITIATLLVFAIYLAKE